MKVYFYCVEVYPKEGNIKRQHGGTIITESSGNDVYREVERKVREIEGTEHPLVIVALNLI